MRRSVFPLKRRRYSASEHCTGVVYNIAAALLIAGIYLVSTLGFRVETNRLVVLCICSHGCGRFLKFSGASRNQQLCARLREVNKPFPTCPENRKMRFLI